MQTLATILPKLVEPESLPSVQELEEFSVSVNQLKNIAFREARSTARAYEGLQALETALECFADIRAWHLATAAEEDVEIENLEIEDLETEHGNPDAIQELANTAHQLEDLS